MALGSAHQRDVPCPAPDFRFVGVVNLRSIAKLITVVVGSPRLAVVEIDSTDIQRYKWVKF